MRFAPTLSLQEVAEKTHLAARILLPGEAEAISDTWENIKTWVLPRSAPAGFKSSVKVPSCKCLFLLLNGVRSSIKTSKRDRREAEGGFICGSTLRRWKWESTCAHTPEGRRSGPPRQVLAQLVCHACCSSAARQHPDTTTSPQACTLRLW